MEKQKEMSTSRKKILVVDDELYVRKCLNAILSKLGHEVVCVKSAIDAVDTFQKIQPSQNPFKIAFVDLHLPEKLGGLKVCEKIREQDKDIQLILASGDTSNPIMLDYKMYGFNGILKKPFSISQVGQSIEELSKLNMIDMED